MSSVIQNLMQHTLGDGARSAKFDCVILFASPTLFNSGDMAVLVKTSHFPGKSHDVIDFKYKGRSIPLKGQTKYDNTWTCTFYLTEDHKLKKGFEDWIESIDQKHNIKKVSKDIRDAQKQYSSIGYTSTMSIYQLDFNNEKQRVAYHLRYAFPKSVSKVEVDYSVVGAILEYTVEFSYAYYDTENFSGPKDNFIDELKNRALTTVDDFITTGRESLTAAAGRLGDKLLGRAPLETLTGVSKGRTSLPSKSNPIRIEQSGITTYVSK